MKTSILMLFLVTLTACGHPQDDSAPAGEPLTDSVTTIMPPPNTTSSQTQYTHPPYEGVTTLEERIADADLIALAHMASVVAAVEEIAFDETREYIGALKVTFNIDEVLKSPSGSSPTQVVAMVGSRRGFKTRAEAQTIANKMLNERDTQWDSRSAIIFLATSSLEYPATLSDALYYMSFIDYTYGFEDNYSLASKRSRLWLPEANTGSGVGGQSSERRFLTGIPQQQAAGAQGASVTSESPSISLTDLNTKITRIKNELNANTSLGYQLCISEKYQRERLEAVRASEGRTYDKERTFNEEIGSGLPAGTAVLDDTWNFVYGPDGWESKSQFIGADAELFTIGATKDTVPRTGKITNSFRAVKGTFDYEWRIKPLETIRPLPKGTYQLTWKYRRGEYILCDPNYVRNHTVVVTVTPPNGTLHEAFFDPVTDGTTVAADSTNGKLEPRGFTDANSASASLQRIEWASGTVKVKVSPHTGLSGQVMDFIELDGSVSLSLDVDDATVDAANNTLSWNVAEQPWHGGDKLMLRIHKALPAPEGVTVSLSGGTFTISWSAVTGAADYRAQYRTGGSEAEWKDLAVTTGTSQTFSPEGGVACGATYEFRVQGRGDGTTYSAAWGKLSESASHTTEACNRAPVFGSATYSFTVAENAAAWQSVGTVSATDPDEGDYVTYHITAGNGAGRFEISSGKNGGLILVWAALDYETTSSYTLTVEARDGKAGGTSSATVEISVTDVAE